ncbi:hypothetical protein Aduo_020008 [Ancylostoma duodenale]
MARAGMCSLLFYYRVASSGTADGPSYGFIPCFPGTLSQVALTWSAPNLASGEAKVTRDRCQVASSCPECSERRPRPEDELRGGVEVCGRRTRCWFRA